MRRMGTLFVVVACLFATTGAGARVRAGAAPRSLDRSTERNRYGAVVRDESGRRFTYTPAQLEAQAREAARLGTPDPTRPAPAGRTADAPFDADAGWTYAVLGAGIGLSNIVTAQNGAHTEIYTGASFDSYWVALQYDAATQGYDEIYVSPVYSMPYDYNLHIESILVGNVTGGPGNEIVVSLTDGRIFLYDQATKALVTTLTTGIAGLAGVAVSDVDADGANEIVICTSTDLFVLSGDGTPEWSVPGAGGQDVVVAQMDNDPAQEIAVTSGRVVDAATHAVQWTWPNGFGYDVESADIDGDGRSELVVATYSGYYIYAYDVERQLPKWSLSAFLDSGGVTLADMDGDTVPEIVYGQQQWGDILVYDAVTLAQEGLIHNPEHGVTNVAVDDVDGDGDLDMLWGAGYTSSGVDYLYVADWNTKTISWQNDDLVGPFVGPQIGDLDGDGRQELVIVSRESNSSYSTGRILVFDARTRQLRATSPPVADGYFGYTHDVRLRDVDHDGRLEIVIAADALYDGALEIYDFDGATNSFARIFHAFSYDLPAFYVGDAADVDGDGQTEAVAAGGGIVYVFNMTTSAVEWSSLYMGGGYVTGLEIADFDGDGHLEIAAMVSGGDVYVFDGVTKELEGVLFGPFYAFGLGPASGGLPTFVAANPDGELVTFGYTATPDPYPYTEIGRHQYLASGGADGFTYDARGRVWIGSGGTLTVFDASGTELWSEIGYGATFGNHTAFLPGSNTFFDTTQFGVVEYTIGTGFGQTTAGVYDAANGSFFLRDALTPGPADTVFGFGPPASGWTPLSGDWNGDGIETPGLFNPATGFFFLKNSNTPGPADLVYSFGPGGAGWFPLAGDWNGDGVDTVGLYSPANGFFFLRNVHAPGGADLVYGFGPPGAGWTPLAGDWNGDGTDTVGLYAPSSGFYFLRNSHAPGAADVVFSFGPPGLTPLAGDWNGM